MRTSAEPVPDDLSRRTRRRRGLVIVGRSLLVATVTVVIYFLLPLTSPVALDTVVELVAGLALLSALLIWEIMGIIRSPFPALQAIATLVVVVPLFLSLFATSYFMMSHADEGSFTEPLTKLDSIYFTVTTFATVGFGDIVARTEVARGVVTLQMAGGLILVGFIARVIAAAVQEARSRHAAERLR